MSSFFDLTRSEGQFRALLVIYLIVVGLRCLGYSFMEQDHTLILGAILTLLRVHPKESPKE